MTEEIIEPADAPVAAIPARWTKDRNSNGDTPIRRSEIPRDLDSAHRIVAAMLEGIAVDLRRPIWCMRHELARAWVDGKYACGCPFEDSGLSFDRVAELLKQHVDDLRRRIIKGMPRRREIRCRDVRQIEMRLEGRRDAIR